MQAAKFDRQHYNAIDLAKFICTILVVMIHIQPFGSTNTAITYYLNFGVQNYLARIAVPFFFVTSGFLLFKKTSLSDFNIDYSKKYIQRIFRLYVIWTLIYFPLVLCGILRDENGVTYAILRYFRNCIFVGSYWHLWYLPALIFAVIIISVLIYKNVQPKYIVALASCFYIVGLFAQSWFGFIAPLKEVFPQAWYFLQMLQKVISTTRNGLFEGFFFVSIGMCFAFYNISIGRTKALIGFCCSMSAMFLEVFILQYFAFIREYDMYLFLVPATFFLFGFIRQINLPDNPVFKTLRLLSSLIFYSHPWVLAVVSRTLRTIYEPLSESFLLFILTLTVTIICSLILIKLSEREKFRWIKMLYS